MGFERFHRRSFVNYQLNRAHALGFADADDLRRAAAEVRFPTDCAPVFDALSAQAARAGRPWQAAGYLRLAEFFTSGRSPDKLPRYRRYRDLFDAALAGTVIVRHEVPCAGATLPAYRYPARGARPTGAVLVHGGFDSLIEEFFAVWQRIAEAGRDVIAFDGPGQGGARRLGGLTFDHDWERPVGAVLDHFAFDSASLVGISMGGYWALRAAGHEPRIDRVVSWPPVYDWLHRIPRTVRPAARAMLARRGFMRWSIRARARMVPTLRLVVDQALYDLGSDDPLDVMDWFLAMNAAHLGSGRVTQDVLLMHGEHDAFQPPVLPHAQAAALTSARSVTVRTFTAAEHADQHCQMGNLDLACRVLTRWLTTTEPGRDERA
ncbi:alpha/beta hydrolase family protein [Geodermatophilus sp. SYSU D00758]